MIEWMQSWPEWLQGLWLTYVTFHDFIQWGIMALLARSAWGQRQRKKELEDLIEHIHEELHLHIDEDAERHESLGQGGMTKGK